MPNYNPKELELCRWLHDHGIRPEIMEGDWIDRKNAPGEISLVPHSLLHFYNDPVYRDNFILLYTWERAREWLREKGRRINHHIDCLGGVLLSFYNEKQLTGRDAIGATDLEAILARMVKVVEGEKL